MNFRIINAALGVHQNTVDSYSYLNVGMKLNIKIKNNDTINKVESVKKYQTC